MRAIVTGSNSGLGFHTAAALAKKNYSVVLAVRSEARGALAASQLMSRVPGCDVTVAKLDLSSFQSIEQFVEDQGAQEWDLLVNNAGAKIERPFKTTQDGFEWHIGVNHLGHFALTAGLWGLRARHARVVTVSSIVARGARLLAENSLESSFHESRAYADSKLLNLMFAQQLSRAIDGAGISAASVAAHPGFARAEPYGTKLTRAAEYVLAQPASKGAESIIEACSGKNGDYFAPRVFQLWGGPSRIKVPDSASNLNDLRNIWAEAEKATGRTFRV